VPPLQALAALHGFWFMVGIGAAIVIANRLTPRQVRLLGMVSTLTGIAGLLIYIGWDLTTWLAVMPPDFGRYSLQRIVFVIGTQTDVPLVQFTVTGVTCWIAGSRRARCVNNPRKDVGEDIT
jgi:hypothetical protein